MDIITHHPTMTAVTRDLLTIVQNGGGNLILPGREATISVEVIDGSVRLLPVAVNLAAYPWIREGRPLSVESWGPSVSILEAVGGMDGVIRFHLSQLTEEVAKRTPTLVICPAGGMEEAEYVFDHCRLTVTFPGPTDSWVCRLIQSEGIGVLETEIGVNASYRQLGRVVRYLLVPEGNTPHAFLPFQEYEWNSHLLDQWLRSLTHLYWTERAGTDTSPPA